MGGFIKNRKGAALITVIMVFAVLIILCTGLIGVSYADSLHSIQQQKSGQAYQTARTGVEIAVKKLKDAIQTTNDENIYFSDIQDFLDNTTIQAAMAGFSDSIAGAGSYNVSFIVNDDLKNNQMIKIYSIGTVGQVKDTTALSLKISCPYVAPNTWLNNGWNATSGTKEKVKTPVIFNTGKNLGHAAKRESFNGEDPNKEAVFIAPSLYFLDNSSTDDAALMTTAKYFTLESNLIDVNGKVKVQNDGSGKLFLNVYHNGTGLLGPDSTSLKTGYGVIYLSGGVWKDTTEVMEDGFYYFKGYRDPNNPGLNPDNALNLDDPVDRAGKMIKVTDSAAIQYLTQLIQNETQVNVDLDDSIWSRN